MQLNDFEEALNRYGPDVKAWPQAMRSAAQACIHGENTQYRTALENANSLCHYFRELPDYPMPGTLWHKLLAIPDQGFMSIDLLQLWRMLMWPGRVASFVGMIAATYLGIWLGDITSLMDAPGAVDFVMDIDSWGLL